MTNLPRITDNAFPTQAVLGDPFRPDLITGSDLAVVCEHRTQLDGHAGARARGRAKECRPHDTFRLGNGRSDARDTELD